MEWLIMIPLSRLIYTDWRERRIELWWWVVFFLCQIVMGVDERGWMGCFGRIGVNCLTLTGLLGGMLLYIKVGRRSRLRDYAGSGDLLFLMSLTPVFGGKAFLWFLILSFAFSLCLWGIFVLAGSRKETIPLVSTVGSCYLVLFGLRHYIFFPDEILNFRF